MGLIDWILDKLLKVLMQWQYKRDLCTQHNYINLPDQRWYKSRYPSGDDYWKILSAVSNPCDGQGTTYWCENVFYRRGCGTIKQNWIMCCDLLGPRYKAVSKKEYDEAKQECLKRMKEGI